MTNPDLLCIRFDVTGATRDQLVERANTAALTFFDGRSFELDINAEPAPLDHRQWLARVTAIEREETA